VRQWVSEGSGARAGLRHCVLTVLAAAAVSLLAVTAAATASVRKTTARRVIATKGTIPLKTALLGPNFVGSERDTALAMAKASGASYVRMSVQWRFIAPQGATPPPGFVATNPTSPGYNWVHYDQILTDVQKAGLTPILDISTVPDWAYATLPKPPNAGSPKAADLGNFAKALATHYNGTVPGAPAEHVFMVWNEPNDSRALDPVNANNYRAMVNAVATAVHSVSPQNLVVAGGTSPFGHPKSKKQKWYSVAPLAFMRSLLCLSKGKKPKATCKTPVHFDVWSHHPYTYGGPFAKAKKADDVSLGDLPTMRTLLRNGVKSHHVISSKSVQFWVTEFGWDTKPPRPKAASLNLASRWTAESLYQMWRSGVSLVTWFLIQDYPSPSPYQSGLYYHGATLKQARVKPVRTAFRFPFVAYLGKQLYQGKGKTRKKLPQRIVTIWGRTATSTKQVVKIQRAHRKAGPWANVATVRSNATGIFKASLRLKATKKDWLRAVSPDSGNSLAFSLTVPHAPHIGPWGA
jgi:hypothetical protein